MSSRCSLRLPWAKLMRATFIPALTRLVSTLAEREAGPIVHTIFVAMEDLRSTTIPRRTRASFIPLMNFYPSGQRSLPLHHRVVRDRPGVLILYPGRDNKLN